MTEQHPGRQPADYQKPAAQLEAERGATATISALGLDFTVPADLDELDGEFLRYAADQDSYRMIETILDAEQFAELRRAKPKIRDYKELGEQIAKLYGFEAPGN